MLWCHGHGWGCKLMLTAFYLHTGCSTVDGHMGAPFLVQVGGGRIWKNGVWANPKWLCCVMVEDENSITHIPHPYWRESFLKGELLICTHFMKNTLVVPHWTLYWSTSLTTKSNLKPHRINPKSGHFVSSLFLFWCRRRHPSCYQDNKPNALMNWFIYPTKM